MTRKKSVCWTLWLCSLLAGCGTMANLDGRDSPMLDLPHQSPTTMFGGVTRDVRWVSEGKIAYAADLPFSLVGDVVTFPRVIGQKGVSKGEWNPAGTKASRKEPIETAPSADDP